MRRLGVFRRGTVLAIALSLAAAGCGTDEPRQAPTTPPNTPSPVTTTTSPSPTKTANPAGLTDEQMVGQVLMTYVYGGRADRVTAEQRTANLALYGAATPADVVRRYHLGGIMLLERNPLDADRPNLDTGNVDSPAQIRAFTQRLQDVARADTRWPLLIAVDQEGGRVQRIKGGVTQLPSQQELAKQAPAALACTYQLLGQQLRALGVNMDFAPVADVARTDSKIIGDRSFGGDVTRTSAAVRAAVRGLQSAGVLATIKHWPGHGATNTDSHKSLPVIREGRAEWERIDRRPFAAASRDAAAVMVGHLAFPNVEGSERPATLSPTLIATELRGRLGFGGLIVTDSMAMQPMKDAGPPGQVALAALAAGNDVLLMSPDLPDVFATLLKAVRTNPQVRRTVQQAATRVLLAKQRAYAQPTPLPCRR